MKKYLIAPILIFSLAACGSGPPSSYDRFLSCQKTATQVYLDTSKQVCAKVSTRFEQSKCKETAFKRFSSSVCSPQMAISLNSIAEMYKQLAALDDPTNSRVYSPSKRDELYGKISKLINDEVIFSIEIAERDADIKKAAYYEARANSNLAATFSILGAQQQTNNTYQNSTASPFSTYILNGKMISCMTTGTMTTCN